MSCKQQTVAFRKRLIWEQHFTALAYCCPRGLSTPNCGAEFNDGIASCPTRVVLADDKLIGFDRDVERRTFPNVLDCHPDGEPRPLFVPDKIAFGQRIIDGNPWPIADNQRVLRHGGGLLGGIGGIFGGLRGSERNSLGSAQKTKLINSGVCKDACENDEEQSIKGDGIRKPPVPKAYAVFLVVLLLMVLGICAVIGWIVGLR